MYDEKKMKFWAIMEIIKKWFIVLIFTGLGLGLGFAISEFVIDVLNDLTAYRTAFIGGATFIGFFIGMVSTSNVERNIQDAYWKIEVMHKLDELCNDMIGFKQNYPVLADSKKMIKKDIYPDISKELKSEIAKNMENTTEIEKATEIETANEQKTTQENTVNNA